MASTFFGLNIATSGIYAAQAGLKTTGHNISNEHTKGYSRQVTNQTAAEALRAYASYGMVGSGVTVTGIDQLRDSYYDVKYRNNEARLGEYTVKNTYTLQIEDYFNEMETDGFSTEYDEMFAKLKSLAGNPANTAYRTEFLNYAQSIAEYLNDVQSKLTGLQKQCNTEVSNMTDKINNLSSQIASLTKQINTVEITGLAANDLRDKRELLLDELSEIVPVEVTETKGNNGNSSYQVKVNGFSLVDTYDAHSLKVVERENPENKLDAPNLYDIYYFYDKDAPDKCSIFDVQSMNLSGSLKATLDVRDGNNGVKDESLADSKAVSYKGAPYYINRIQEFKQTLADSFNEIHQNNKRIDENGNEVPANYNLYGQTTEDIPIFKMSDNGVLSVNQDLLDDPSLLAASAYPIQDGKDDGGLIDELIKLNSKPLYNNSNAKEYLQSIMTEISVDVNKSATFSKNYTNIKKSVENQRMSVSGVDGDEEAMNLTKYQEAFELSSKMISVMQQIYNKLINETGI